MPYKKESDEPLTKEELTDIIFDTTYTMDLENEENAKSYDCLKLKYIALFEGEEKYAYDDARRVLKILINMQKIFLMLAA